VDTIIGFMACANHDACWPVARLYAKLTQKAAAPPAQQSFFKKKNGISTSPRNQMKNTQLGIRV
jgi:hypothetical protein